MGQGSYADVVSAIHKPTGRKVAIKRMKGIFDDEVDCKRILREIYLLLNLRHPYIVQLLDIIEPTDLKTFDTIYVVLSLSESDLKKLIKSAINLDHR
jgi:mitogen-activated protein kinase 1/3